MWIRRAERALAGALLLALAASPAAGEPPREVDDDSVWADVARPNRGRYDLLVASAGELLDSRNPREALPLLEEATRLEPRRAPAWGLLAVARYRDGRFPGCAAALDQHARASGAERPPVSGLLASLDEIRGLCLALSGRLDEAVAHYRRVLAGAPAALALDTLHLRLGDCYHALGRLDEAIAEYLVGITLSPREASLYYGLAVAYDRDEQGTRAHEAMLRALERDPQLVELGSANTILVPPEDRAYYFGLAHQMAAEDDRMRRPLALVFFRKYVAAVPSGPWTPRARAHLLELGTSSLDERDVGVAPADAPDAAPLRKKLAALLPELQRCLDGYPHAAVRAGLTFVAAAKGRPPEPGALSTSSAGPEVSAWQVNECLEKKLHGVRLAPSRLIRGTLVLISK